MVFEVSAVSNYCDISARLQLEFNDHLHVCIVFLHTIDNAIHICIIYEADVLITHTHTHTHTYTLTSQ